MRQVTPKPADRLRSTPVYDTPSGLGGTFTVAIVEDRGAGRVLVSVCYGCFRDTAGAWESPWESWREWDGAQFETDRAALTNPGTLGDPWSARRERARRAA